MVIRLFYDYFLSLVLEKKGYLVQEEERNSRMG
jgi:hypothetical protein